MPSEKLEKSSKIVLKKLNIMDQNNSQSDLVREDGAERTLRDLKFKEWTAVFILCFVNLINYMDRFTLAGILEDIQAYYGIDESSAGLLQTAFVVFYTIFAPIFGYLGDRYSRRWIMAFGVTLWSITTLGGSYMTNFGWFILFRALVGVGEASYSTIAPTILSDLFVGDIRSKMLALFYFAIPVGSGLGYIVGSETAKAAGAWQWALRVTPFLGFVAVILIVFVLKEPDRGAAESSGHLQTTTWFEDVKDIIQNKSFMLSTAGFTCVAFVAGALAWWGPKFIAMGIRLHEEGEDDDSVSIYFGAVAMGAGLVGVCLGIVACHRLRPKWPRADPVICAAGMFCAVPLLLGAALAVDRVAPALTYLLLFLGQVAINVNWAIVVDILLYVVVPTRRSTAEGFQLLVSHALGDAGSPYLIGVMSDAFGRHLQTTGQSDDMIKFKSLQYALFSTCFVEVLGGFFFLSTAFYVVQDKSKVDRAVQGNSQGLLVNEDQQYQQPS